MSNFRKVGTKEMHISSDPMRSLKAYSCVISVIRLGEELLLAHYIPKETMDQVKLFFQRDLSFLERNLLDTRVRRALILGGNNKTVEMTCEYFRALDIDILYSKATEPFDYQRRDVFAFPIPGYVYEVTNGIAKKYEI